MYCTRVLSSSVPPVWLEDVRNSESKGAHEKLQSDAALEGCWFDSTIIARAKACTSYSEIQELVVDLLDEYL